MKYHNILDDIVGEYFPAGYPDEECPTFLAIDEQIMKFGSLQHFKLPSVSSRSL